MMVKLSATKCALAQIQITASTPSNSFRSRVLQSMQPRMFSRPKVWLVWRLMSTLMDCHLFQLLRKKDSSITQELVSEWLPKEMALPSLLLVGSTRRKCFHFHQPQIKKSTTMTTSVITKSGALRLETSSFVIQLGVYLLTMGIRSMQKLTHFLHISSFLERTLKCTRNI